MPSRVRPDQPSIPLNPPSVGNGPDWARRRSTVCAVFGFTVPLEAQRFDQVVRVDFFLGFGGDEARLKDGGPELSVAPDRVRELKERLGI